MIHLKVCNTVPARKIVAGKNHEVAPILWFADHGLVAQSIQVKTKRLRSTMFLSVNSATNFRTD